MKQVRVKGHIDSEKDAIDFSLDIYLFKDEGLIYAYCPSLNIMGYANNQKEAKEEMDYLLQEYFDFTLKKGTLSVDLSEHGWREDGNGQFIAPSVSYLMRRYTD